MKRDIKFRAWDTIHNKMSNDFTLLAAINQDQAFVCPENFEYMQFTGLKDNNGVEIYEGDIVKGTVGGSTDGEISPEEQTIKCEFEREGYWSTICFNDDVEMEVIGNIYENPELLK